MASGVDATMHPNRGGPRGPRRPGPQLEEDTVPSLARLCARAACGTMRGRWAGARADAQRHFYRALASHVDELPSGAPPARARMHTGCSACGTAPYGP